MQYLSKLVTKDTPILHLHNDRILSQSMKENIIGSCYKRKYEDYIYLYGTKLYFFKKEEVNYGYPFYLIDELMGSFLAQKRNIRAVSYEITKVKNRLGLSSCNFKNPNFDYYLCKNSLFSSFLSRDSISNIDALQSFAKIPENKQLLLDHLLELLALDVYMLQKDRCSFNLQLEIDPISELIDFAPLYDFSNCADCVGLGGLYINNPIIVINDLNIRQLLKKFPQLKEIFTFYLDQKMSDSWIEICNRYHFNQDCFAYHQILEYYKTKEENQKKYIKKLL